MRGFNPARNSLTRQFISALGATTGSPPSSSNTPSLVQLSERDFTECESGLSTAVMKSTTRKLQPHWAGFATRRNSRRIVNGHSERSEEPRIRGFDSISYLAWYSQLVEGRALRSGDTLNLESNQFASMKRRMASTSPRGSSVPNANFRPTCKVIATASQPVTL